MQTTCDITYSSPFERTLRVRLSTTLTRRRRARVLVDDFDEIFSPRSRPPFLLPRRHDLPQCRARALPPRVVPPLNVSVLPRAVRRAHARHGEEDHRVPEQERIQFGAHPREHLEETNRRRDRLVNNLPARSLRRRDRVLPGFRRGVRGSLSLLNRLGLVPQPLLGLLCLLYTSPSPRDRG